MLSSTGPMVGSSVVTSAVASEGLDDEGPYAPSVGCFVIGLCKGVSVVGLGSTTELGAAVVGIVGPLVGEEVRGVVVGDW